MERYERYESYLKKLKSGHFKRCVRVDWLNPDESIAWSIDDKLYDISGSINVTYQSGSRRTGSLTVKDLSIDYDNIWIGQKIQIWTGIYLDDEKLDPIYFSQGIFYITNPKDSYQPNKKTVTFSLVDKWAMLDGTVGGYLTGTYLIKPLQNLIAATEHIRKSDRFDDSGRMDETNNISRMLDPKPTLFDSYFYSATTQVPVYTTDTLSAVYSCAHGIYALALNDSYAYEARGVIWDKGSNTYITSKQVNSEITAEDLKNSTSLTKEMNIYYAPYTIKKEAGGTLADVYSEVSTALMGKQYYDRNGYLVYTPLSTSLNDFSDENRQIAWEFNVSEKFFLGADLESKFKEVYNDITVLGKITNGRQAKAKIQNQDDESDTCVQRIGLKSKAPYKEDNYLTDKQCLDLAQYYAQIDAAMEKAGTFNSVALPHLDVDQIVTLTIPEKKIYQEQYLITGLSIPLAATGTMSITVTNIRNFKNWTQVPFEEE